MKFEKLIPILFLSTASLFAQNTPPNTATTETAPIKPTGQEETKTPQTTTQTPPLQQDGTAQPQAKPEVVEPYKSPLKANLSGEYLRSLQVTATQRKAIQSNPDLWFADKYKVGFGLRPKADAITNLDFDKTTADTRNSIVNQTQFYLIGDLTPNVLFKVAFQDVRLWGGEVISAGNQDQKYAVISNAGTTYDTTKQSLVAVNNYAGFREAFLDLKTSKEGIRLRTGRQIIDFGDGRIVGARNDSLNGNSFDAIRLTTKIENHTTDVFASVISTESNSNGLVANNSTKLGGPGEAYYAGIHHNFKVADWLGIDVYDFSLFKKRTAVKNPPDWATEQIYRDNDQMNTYGFRLTNRTKNNAVPDGVKFDWMVESAWQSGYTGQRVAPDWMNQDGKFKTNQNTGAQPAITQNAKYDSNLVAVQLGYSPVKEFRIGVQYVQASGDPNRNDSSVGTYNPLFATRRMAGGSIPFAGNGNSGAVFWQNVKDYSVHLKYEAGKWGTFIFNPHWYYKVKLQDGYYDNNNYVTGSAKTGGLASTEDYYNTQQYNQFAPRLGKKIATELNFIYIVTPFENVSFWFGASQLYGGDAIRNQKNNMWNADPVHRYDFKPTASYFTFQTVFAI